MMLRLAPHLVGPLDRLSEVPAGNAFEPATRAWITKDRTVPGHIGNRVSPRATRAKLCSAFSRRRGGIARTRAALEREGLERMTENVRSPSWKWWVCALLLLASAIN